MKKYLYCSAAIAVLLCLTGLHPGSPNSLQVRSANSIPGSFQPIEFKINALAKLSGAHIVWIAIDPNNKQWRCYADVEVEDTAICNPE